MRELPERDWKAFKKIRDRLYTDLCARINREAGEILNDETLTEEEKYSQLSKHIKSSRKIVNSCFSRYSRSSLPLTLVVLRKYKLLTDEHLKNFTEETRRLLKNSDEIQNMF